MQIGVTAPGEAETIFVLGDRIRFMGEVPGAGLHALEITVPPGSGTPPHRHASVELFHIVTGEVTFGAFDGAPRQVVAGPGTVVTVPSGAAHNYINAGAAEARMLVLLDGQMVAFFRDIGATVPPPPGPTSDAAIAKLLEGCARHGIEILQA
jgi:quercetin dioxygenase-like cupin family protein